MKFTEVQLQGYASPIGKTEDEKCKNALRMVRDALAFLGYSDYGRIEEAIHTDSFAYSLKMSTSSSREVRIRLNAT